MDGPSKQRAPLESGLSGEKDMSGFQKTNSGEPLFERASAENDAALLDVRQVAALLTCSTRHVYRLTDAGRMPRPVNLGRLVRWRRAEIEAWIAEGCPPVRRVGGGQ